MKDDEKKHGFSLVETLVVVSIFILLSLSLFSYLLTTIIGTTRAAITNEIRQNGNYAMSVIESLILPAIEVNVIGTDTLVITPADGANETRIVCLCKIHL